MGIGTTFSIKAPKLVTFLKEIGIDIDSENGVFTERSNITLPSGEKAFFYDDDSMAKHIGGQALYDDEEFGMPRWLHGIGEGDSLVEWFMNHLVDVGEEELIERFKNKEYSCIDFCREAKEIVDRSFPREKGHKKIKALDDLIEEASFLYLSCWGVPDLNFTYVEVKNGKASYRIGCGFENEELYENWDWDDYGEFIELVKEHTPAIVYKRQKGKWIKDKNKKDTKASSLKQDL